MPCHFARGHQELELLGRLRVYSDGVLTIQIPVLEAAQPRKIEIAHFGERREITGS